MERASQNFQGLIRAPHCMSLQRFCSDWGVLGLGLNTELDGNITCLVDFLQVQENMDRWTKKTKNYQKICCSVTCNFILYTIHT